MKVMEGLELDSISTTMEESKLTATHSWLARFKKMICFVRSVTVDAPIDGLPLFVKAGSIIPVMDPRVQTLNTATNSSVVTMASMEVHVLFRIIVLCSYMCIGVE